MTQKRFIGSSGGVYDQYKGDRFTWAEWEEILQIMNNLDEKARERSKALSKLQKKYEELKHNHDVFVYRRMNDANKISDLEKENKKLEKLLKCSREEANDYCEELMEKDEFIRLYKRQRDEVIEENKHLKKQSKLLYKDIKDLLKNKDLKLS